VKTGYQSKQFDLNNLAQKKGGYQPYRGQLFSTPDVDVFPKNYMAPKFEEASSQKKQAV
jgi:hypothetical protein